MLAQEQPSHHSYRRSSSHHPLRLPPGQHPPQLPPHGGSITISIEKHADDPQAPTQFRQGDSLNPHVKRFARSLDQRLTLEAIKRARRTPSSENDFIVEQSDHVENVSIVVRWETSPNVWGISLPEPLIESESQKLNIVSDWFGLCAI